MPFLIRSLPKSHFQPFFELSEGERAARHAVGVIANKKPGFPCRVSLMDAEVGEEMILVNYEHQTAGTPFRSSHAVYVRREAHQANLQKDEVPEMLRSRTLSLRAFDGKGMMIAADLVDGLLLEKLIEEMFGDPGVAYIHIHFAKPGCYAARADRA
jgi:hypothetical protein